MRVIFTVRDGKQQQRNRGQPFHAPSHTHRRKNTKSREKKKQKNKKAQRA